MGTDFIALAERLERMSYFKVKGTVAEAAAALREAHAEIERLRKDAERYRWMRDNDTHTHGIIFYVPAQTTGVNKWIEGTTVDAAIDAGIAGDRHD